jgi:hypothetical protein
MRASRHFPLASRKREQATRESAGDLRCKQRTPPWTPTAQSSCGRVSTIPTQVPTAVVDARPVRVTAVMPPEVHRPLNKPRPESTRLGFAVPPDVSTAVVAEAPRVVAAVVPTPVTESGGVRGRRGGEPSAYSRARRRQRSTHQHCCCKQQGREETHSLHIGHGPSPPTLVTPHCSGASSGISLLMASPAAPRWHQIT